MHENHEKSINVLDGLYVYWEEILKPSNWLSHIKANPIVSLSKLYLSTDYISDIHKILNYFELPCREILMIISKSTTRNNDTDSNCNLDKSMRWMLQTN
jgi:hypothetical protein